MFKNPHRGCPELVVALVLSLLACAAPARDMAEAIAAAATGDHRSDANIARNGYRHPIRTLLWFGLRADMTVVEIWPGGGGWYTEVLAPVLREKGRLIAANYGPSSDAEYFAQNMLKFREKLASRAAVYDRVEVVELMPPLMNEAAPAGSADMVLSFRNLHNWMQRGIATDMLASAYRALKPGGIFGLVAHRAAPGTPDRPKDGYVTEATAVRLAQDAGFRYLDRAEINANGLDTRDHPEGVWTLPPVYRGDHNPERLARIGESDRMTLMFQKPVD